MNEQSTLTLTSETHAAVAAFHAAAVALLTASAEATRAEAELRRAGFEYGDVDEIIATVMEGVVENGPQDYSGFRDTDGTWHDNIDS